jgi:hypothetical protein
MTWRGEIGDRNTSTYGIDHLLSGRPAEWIHDTLGGSVGSFVGGGFRHRPETEDTKFAIRWALPPGLFALAGILYALNVPLFVGFVLPSLARARDG